MVVIARLAVCLSMDGAPLMIRFDNDHHGTFDAGVGAVHPITVIPCGAAANTGVPLSSSYAI
jgi:hypothetical protein